MGGGCWAWSETYPVPEASLGKAPRLRYQPFPPALLLLACSISFHDVPWNVFHIQGVILAGKFKMEFLPAVSTQRMHTSISSSTDSSKLAQN